MNLNVAHKLGSCTCVGITDVSVALCWQVYGAGEILAVPGLGSRPGNWQGYNVPETEGFQSGMMFQWFVL